MSQRTIIISLMWTKYTAQAFEASWTAVRADIVAVPMYIYSFVAIYSIVSCTMVTFMLPRWRWVSCGER